MRTTAHERVEIGTHFASMFMHVLSHKPKRAESTGCEPRFGRRKNLRGKRWTVEGNSARLPRIPGHCWPRIVRGRRPVPSSPNYDETFFSHATFKNILRLFPVTYSHPRRVIDPTPASLKSRVLHVHSQATRGQPWRGAMPCEPRNPKPSPPRFLNPDNPNPLPRPQLRSALFPKRHLQPPPNQPQSRLMPAHPPPQAPRKPAHLPQTTIQGRRKHHEDPLPMRH
jgi:hypothetical protein